MMLIPASLFQSVAHNNPRFLASENKIDIAIPEFSFLEVRGKIGERFKRREEKLYYLILK